MSVLDEELLARTMVGLQESVSTRRSQLASLSADLQKEERELLLLSEVARLRGLTVDGLTEAVETESEAGFLASDQAHELATRSPLVEGVLRILRENGAPMHIQDLLARLQGAGVDIPGRGSSANLIAHIRNSDEIVRPVRGMYGLPEWGLADAPGARRPARRRRATSPRTRVRRSLKAAKPREGRK